MRLQGRSAIVTGAGNGIGRGIAQRFGAEGAAVLATDIDEAAANRVAAAIVEGGGRALALGHDVRDPRQAEAAVALAVAEFGRLDILVSNAGVTTRYPFLDMTRTQFAEILEINLVGTFVCGQAAARQMAAQGAGRIVNITSISGQRGGTGRAAYGASKAGIINLTQVMAVELAPHGILVNAIAPGTIVTGAAPANPVHREAFLERIPLKRFGTVDEVATAAVFLASGELGFVTGHVLNVDGGFNGAGVMYDAGSGI